MKILKSMPLELLEDEKGLCVVKDKVIGCVGLSYESLQNAFQDWLFQIERYHPSNTLNSVDEQKRQALSEYIDFEEMK